MGAVFGQVISDKVTGNEKRRFKVFLRIQTIFFIIVAISHRHIQGDVLVFMLGLLAGYELDIFRKLGATTANNGIMTGNAKNLATNLYRYFVKKDSQAGKTAGILLVTILIFILGVGIGTFLTYFSLTVAIWSFSAVSAVQILITYFLWGDTD